MARPLHRLVICLSGLSFSTADRHSIEALVQREGGAYSASLGTLVFKADIGMKDAGFADPKIAERPKDGLIVVTCALGGQAKLGAKVLVDYGFTNVKVVEGGCVAWKGAGI